MPVITRAVQNNTSSAIELFIPGYNTIKPSVSIPGSTTVDLFTVVTGDELQALQNELATQVSLGNFTVTETVNTDTFNPIGGAAGITALTGDVTASGTGSVTATIANGVIAPSMIASTGNFTFPATVTATTGLTVGTISGASPIIVFQAGVSDQVLIEYVAGNSNLWDVGLQTDSTYIIYDAANGVENFVARPHGACHFALLTTTEKDALTATEGDMVYDTTLHGISFYNGTSWVTLTTSD